MSFHIHPARTASELQIATRLVKAYAASLGIDLGYQDFSTEIENMPGKYAPPEGEILLAIDTNNTHRHHGGSSSSNGSGPHDNPDDRLSCGCSQKSREVEADTLSALVLGCAALRPLPDPLLSTSPPPPPQSSSNTKSSPGSQNCELKRLYVVPSARGRGVGRALLHAIIFRARERGYSEMRLDTLGHMHGAMALYREAGFEETQAYYETPVGDTVFFALRL